MSKNEFNFNKDTKDKTITPGPGQYISQTQHRKIKGNNAPFNIASLRFSTDPNMKNPGPGDYEDKLHYNKGWIKKFYKRHITNKANNNTERNEHKSLIILTDSSSNNHKYPIQSDKKQKKKAKVFQINPLVKSNSEQIPIPSIPTKQMGIGYDVNNEGNLVKKTNPNFYKTFTGEKFDSVGPGNYELEFSDKWLQTGTQWSKMKQDRSMTLSNYNHKPKYCLETLIHIDPLNQNHLQNKRNMLLQNIWRQSSNVTKYNIKPEFKLKSFNDRDFVDYRLIRERNLPGPGYYEDKLSNSIDNKLNKTSKQSFFNITAKYRDSKFGIDNDKEKEKGGEGNSDGNSENLGPGSYFRPMNKHEQKKLMRIKMKIKEDDNPIQQIPFTSTCERFRAKKNNNNSLGPGKYYKDNIDNDYIHKTFNNTQIQFGLKEVRFPKRNELDYHNRSNPGPGTYINPYSCTGTENTVNCKGILISLNKAKQNTHCTIPPIQHPIHSDIIPPVGLYNPEKHQSIEYKNFKKVTSSQPSINTCFNSSKKSPYTNSKYSSMESKVGPGAYLQSKPIKETQIYPPFNISQKKLLNNDKQIGPAKYDLSLPWNKQSFNVNFLS